MADPVILHIEPSTIGAIDELARKANQPRDVLVEEALQNFVKHGGSRHARVSLQGQADTIKLTVKDSGAGFHPQEALRGPGLGLTSMQERMKVVGGQLSIHSQRGRGTMVHAVAPLSSPAKPAGADARNLRRRENRESLGAGIQSTDDWSSHDFTFRAGSV